MKKRATQEVALRGIEVTSGASYDDQKKRTIYTVSGHGRIPKQTISWEDLLKLH